MSKSTARLAGIAALAIVAAAAWVAYVRFSPAGPTSTAAAAPDAPAVSAEEGRATFIRWFVAQPRLEINLSAEGAKVLILKFNDFQCPPCAQSHTEYMPIIKKVLSEHPGAVRYQMVDYPLESECNPYVAIGPHAAACEAAAAVRMAWGHNRQDAMMDWLFANQPQLTPAIVRQAAKDVGQIPDFDKQYAPTIERIKGDIELGHYLGIRETPTFVVNGIVLEGRFAPDYIEAAIEHELRAAAK